jgi:hypothetical protein
MGYLMARISSFGSFYDVLDNVNRRSNEKEWTSWTLIILGETK